MSAPPPSDNPPSSSPWVLFGIDLSTVGQDWLEAMRRLYAVAPLRWFELNPVIQVLRNEGSMVRWQADHVGGLKTGAPIDTSASQALFSAIELPEDLILRRTLTLPHLPNAQIRDAVALDLMSSSPFQADDIAWGYVQTTSDNGVQIHSAFASRTQIAQYVERVRAQYGWHSQGSEVWAFVPGTTQPILFQGYGEPLAERARNKRRLQTSLALVILTGLITALAITPTLQVRQQAIQAEQAYKQLLAQTGRVTEERAQFTKALNGVAQIKQYNEQRVNPLEILEMLSEVLPKDVSVNSLQIEGQTVELTAEADNAAAIIQNLSELEAFSEVRTTRPVQQVAQVNKERFTVEMHIAPGAFNAKYSVEAFVEPAPAEAKPPLPAASTEPAAPSPLTPEHASPSSSIDSAATTSTATIGGQSVRRSATSDNSGVAPPPPAPQPLKPQTPVADNPTAPEANETPDSPGQNAEEQNTAPEDDIDMDTIDEEPQP